MNNEQKEQKVQLTQKEKDEKEEKKQLLCLKKNMNLSNVKLKSLFYNEEFKENKELYFERKNGLKYLKLVEKINELDDDDKKTSNRLFKHLIFINDKGIYGAKSLYTFLIHRGFNSLLKIGSKKISMMNPKNTDKNMMLLSSGSINKISYTSRLVKKVLTEFNRRPDNIYGKNIRFIVLDGGYKEGVDIYDIKYIHILDTPLSTSDYKQIVGRGTRYCGQKGLNFVPNIGWPLKVFMYQTEGYNNMSVGEYIKRKYTNIDLIEQIDMITNLAIRTSIDYNLNKNMNGTVNLSLTNEYERLQKFISIFYKKYKYLITDKKDLCNVIEPFKFTNTQKFISSYFTPEVPQKGMLLWHSVGTGKTCTSILTASKNFQEKGYKVLWVTKSSLKNDMWKNIFNQPCHYKTINTNIDNKRTFNKVNSTKWFQPLSYKQFSNLLLKKSKVKYQELKKQTSKSDILKKTLIIIDEAHKLYDKNISKKELHDINVIEKYIYYSYKKSKNDSCRLLLLTATPIVNNLDNLFSLLNLLKDNNKFNPKMKLFNKDNELIPSKIYEFVSKAAGLISYLDRSKDSSKFANIVSEEIITVKSSDTISDEFKKCMNEYDYSGISMISLNRNIKHCEKSETRNCKNSKSDDTNKCKTEFKKCREECKTKNKKEKTECNKVCRNTKKTCLDNVDESNKNCLDNVSKVCNDEYKDDIRCAKVYKHFSDSQHVSLKKCLGKTRNDIFYLKNDVEKNDRIVKNFILLNSNNTIIINDILSIAIEKSPSNVYRLLKKTNQVPEKHHVELALEYKPNLLFLFNFYGCKQIPDKFKIKNIRPTNNLNKLLIYKIRNVYHLLLEATDSESAKIILSTLYEIPLFSSIYKYL